jgi:hypothetical protein
MANEEVLEHILAHVKVHPLKIPVTESADNDCKNYL